jgi:TolB-like protein/Tfp pilus assembly protein PilF
LEADIEQPSGTSSTAAGEQMPVDRHASVWERIREHKLIQWGIAYLGVALALAQGQELVARAFSWPDVVGRTLVIALVAGLPVALTLAWYHGHRGLQRISAGELTIISLLLLIGALLFSVSMRPVERTTAEPAINGPAGASGGTTVVTPNQPSRTVPNSGSANDILPNSIAVLPFENLSPNSDDAAFAIGIHLQILNQLARINALTSIARASVLRFADTDMPPQDIARELKVETVMTGSVRYADGNVRITTQLIDGASGAQLWSEIYTRPFENVFEIESDIATQVAAALEAELAPDEQRKLVKQPTESGDAYGYYLRAIAAIAYPGGGLGVSAEESAEFHKHIDRALEIDPEFALAYAAKAREYAYSMGRDLPRSAGLNFEDRATLAIANAERALALDPDLGLAHAALANVHRLSGRRQLAQESLERALALAPNNFQVLFDAVVLNFTLNNPEEAMRHAQHAARLSPVESFLPLGLAFVRSGDYEAAIAQFESRPDYPNISIELARAEYLRGNETAVVRHLREQERRGIRPPATIPTVAYLYHLVGEDNDARRVAATLDAYADEFTVGSGDWAIAALSTGDTDVALQWLEHAASRRTLGADAGALLLIALNFWSDPVLDRPEFVEVRNRLAPR